MTDDNKLPEATEQQKAPSPWVKMGTEFGPLMIFFISFKLGGIFTATAVFMAAIVVSFIISKKMFGKVSPMLKLTFVIVMVMGGLTLYLQDETFVKMKLTMINSFFGVILIYGLFRKRLYLKMVMEMAFDMDTEGWVTFTKRYIVFLLSMAAINEAIWRTQTTDFWVNFKTFGYMGLTFVFILAQMPLFMKYMPEEELEKHKKD